MSNLIASHLPCEDCDSSNALSQYEDNSYCFSCGICKFTERRASLLEPVSQEISTEFSLPPDYTWELPEKAKAWFYKYRIYNPESDLAVGWSKTLNRVILPIFDSRDPADIKLIAYQARDLSGNESQKYLTFKNPEFTAKPRFFFPEYSSEQTIVVEDILSTLRVGRAAGPTVGLLGTSIDDDLRLYLALNKKVIIWLDGDDPGITAATKIYNKLHLHTNVKIIHTPKDPKEYSDEEIKQILGVNNDKRSDTTAGNEA